MTDTVAREHGQVFVAVLVAIGLAACAVSGGCKSSRRPVQPVMDALSAPLPAPPAGNTIKDWLIAGSGVVGPDTAGQYSLFWGKVVLVDVSQASPEEIDGIIDFYAAHLAKTVGPNWGVSSGEISRIIWKKPNGEFAMSQGHQTPWYKTLYKNGVNSGLHVHASAYDFEVPAKPYATGQPVTLEQLLAKPREGQRVLLIRFWLSAHGYTDQGQWPKESAVVPATLPGS